MAEPAPRGYVCGAPLSWGAPSWGSPEFEALSDPHNSFPHGPWSHPPEPAPVRARPQLRRLRLTRGFLIWLAIVSAGIALYVALMLLFPGQLVGNDQANALQMLGWLALVSSGLVFARRMKFGEVMRNVGV
ncbi:MAG TPA: hypothetical protein VHS81_07375 [Caulobacteraceae bacterium]|nr:hypothetical protein [Caulobacteraceae bacterium]